MHVPAAHPRRSTFASQVEVFLLRRGIRLGSLGIRPSTRILSLAQARGPAGSDLRIRWEPRLPATAAGPVSRSSRLGSAPGGSPSGTRPWSSGSVAVHHARGLGTTREACWSPDCGATRPPETAREVAPDDPVHETPPVVPAVPAPLHSLVVPYRGGAGFLVVGQSGQDPALARGDGKLGRRPLRRGAVDREVEEGHALPPGRPRRTEPERLEVGIGPLGQQGLRRLSIDGDDPQGRVPPARRRSLAPSCEARTSSVTAPRGRAKSADPPGAQPSVCETVPIRVSPLPAIDATNRISCAPSPRWKALLMRAVHRSRREIEELVAELSPRPDAPAVMRKLPDRRAGTTSPALRLGPDTEVLSLGLRPDGGASVDRQLRPDGVGAREPELRSDGVAVASVELPLNGGATCEAELRSGGVAAAGDERLPPGAAVRPASPRARPAEVEPLAPGCYRVQFTASVRRPRSRSRRGYKRASPDERPRPTPAPGPGGPRSRRR
jgi:hypothetical protein